MAALAAAEAPDNDDDGVLPPHLRRLARLVTVLTVVMIAGFVVLIAALVFRLSAEPPPLPERISLPEGVSPVAVTQGPDWIAVVGSDERIFLFSREGGAPFQVVEIGR